MPKPNPVNPHTHHTACAACGLQITAASLFDAWQLFDRHVDEAHGRSFPRGVLPSAMGRRNGIQIAPPTPQGGQ